MASFVVIGKKPKGTKSYLPRKNTAAYAILITLLRYDFLRYIPYMLSTKDNCIFSREVEY
jgi:hypothetical protein